MSILARLEQQHQKANRRGSPRRRLWLETESATTSDSHASVVIRDISRTGLLIETAAAVPVGSHLEVQLPEAGPVDARVVWKSGRYFGCRFDQPISRAALSAALLRSPAPSAERPKSSDLVANALAEVKLLRLQVEQLSATVEDVIGGLEREPRVSVPVAPAHVEPREEAAEEREEDTRLSFSMRMRIMLALAVGSWALILWLIGVF